jgi:hypothetical protein
VEFALIPLVVVAALAAFVAAGVVAIVRRTAKVPARASGTLAVRRRAVAVLCVAAAAIAVTGVVLGTRAGGEVGDGQVAALFSPPAAAQVTTRTRAAQVYAWNLYGGTELNQRLAGTMKRHATTLLALGSATGPIDVSPVRSTCAEFGQIARDAERYFRIPDETAQQHWRRYVELAKRGSADCVNALDQGPERLFYRSLDELTNAMSAANSAVERLTRIAGG